MINAARVEAPSAAASFISDVRSLVLAAVLATAAWSPNFTLRQGAVIVAVIAALTPTALNRLRILDVVVVAYAGFAWASNTWTQAPQWTLLGATNTLACAALFIGIRVAAQRRRDLQLLMAGMVTGSAIGLYRMWSENAGYASIRLEYDANAERIGLEGLNVNALSYGIAVGAAMLVILVAAGRSTTRARLLAAGALLLAFWIGILQTGTRGAVISMILGAVWLAACWLAGRGRRRFPLRALVILAAAFACLIFSGVLDGWLKTLFGDVSAREDGFLNGRLRAWPIARDLFWSEPIFGAGLDATVASPPYIGAHNIFLDVAAGLGIIGLALFIAVIVLALRDGARGSDGGLRALQVGTYLAVATPIALTGFWIEAPVMWTSLALISRLTAFHSDALVPNGDRKSGAAGLNV